jgi:molybdopterin/thiamine biosynthesis adenylyltransferase
VSAELSESERERYARQIERIGLEAQQRLKAARAIVLGVRAAGSAAAAQLASCGVGYVGIVDGGDVVPPDLCGQSLLYTPDVGSNRAEAVAAKLGVLNTDAQAESYPVDVEEANAEAILMGHDLAVDCRGGGHPVEDACRATGVRLVVAPGSGARDGLDAAEQALAALAAPAAVTEGAPA